MDHAFDEVWVEVGFVLEDGALVVGWHGDQCLGVAVVSGGEEVVVVSEDGEWDVWQSGESGAEACGEDASLWVEEEGDEFLFLVGSAAEDVRVSEHFEDVDLSWFVFVSGVGAGDVEDDGLSVGDVEWLLCGDDGDAGEVALRVDGFCGGAEVVCVPDVEDWVESGGLQHLCGGHTLSACVGSKWGVGVEVGAHGAFVASSEGAARCVLGV